MKKLFILFLLMLCGCRTRYELIAVDEDGSKVYRTLCKKEQTTCLVYAAKACDGKYEIVDWEERGYEYSYMSPTRAAISITNTIITKKASETEKARSYTKKEVLIFRCKNSESQK